MKKLILMIVGMAVMAGSSFAAEAEKDVNWDAFGKNLEAALKSSNDGLKQSAMRHLIKYGEQVNVGDAKLEILRVYRSHEDFQTRRLALAALPKTGSNLMIGFLRRAVDFERSEVLKRQIQFIVAEDNNR